MIIANNNTIMSTNYFSLDKYSTKYIIMAIKTTEDKNMPCLLSGINSSIMIINIMTS